MIYESDGSKNDSDCNFFAEPKPKSEHVWTKLNTKRKGPTDRSCHSQVSPTPTYLVPCFDNGRNGDLGVDDDDSEYI